MALGWPRIDFPVPRTQPGGCQERFPKTEVKSRRNILMGKYELIVPDQFIGTPAKTGLLFHGDFVYSPRATQRIQWK